MSKYMICPCCKNLIVIPEDTDENVSVFFDVENQLCEQLGIMLGSAEKGGEEDKKRESENCNI